MGVKQIRIGKGTRGQPAGPCTEGVGRAGDSASCCNLVPVRRARRVHEACFGWVTLQCAPPALHSASRLLWEAWTPCRCTSGSRNHRDGQASETVSVCFPRQTTQSQLPGFSVRDHGPVALPRPRAALGPSDLLETWSPHKSFQEPCQHSQMDTCPVGTAPEPEMHRTQAT